MPDPDESLSIASTPGAAGAGLARLVNRFRSRGVARNGLFSMIQGLVTLVCVFLSYRIVIAEAGLASLGLWSLLMVFAGMAQTLDVSGASALARSVARHEQETPDARLAEVVHTVLLTSLAINCVLMAAVLAFVPLALDTLVEPSSRGLAIALLPWVGLLMLTLPLSVGVAATIDGLHRADQRAMIVAGSAVVGLAVAWIAVPRLGLVGLAVAQLCQQMLVILGGWLFLRRRIEGLGWAPSRWRGFVFRKTAGYAVKLNVIGVLGLLFDPLTKFCINAVGGLSAIAIYELASRLIVQVRTIILGAATPLIPAFAASAEVDRPRFEALLRGSSNFAILAALAIAGASLLAAPFMSLVILRTISVPLLQTNALLALGWSLNALSLPLYLAAQGHGRLAWNIASHLVLGAVVLLSTVFLVPLFAVDGVTIGVALGLTLSAAVTITGNAIGFRAISIVLHLLPRLAAASGLIGLACLAVWSGISSYG